MSAHTLPQHPSAKISPSQMIRRLLFRLRGRGEDGLELDVLEHQIDRHQVQLAQATHQAVGIESTFVDVRAKMYACLVDERSPGVIDEEEAKELGRDLLAGTVQAHRHVETLEGMA